MRARNLKPGFFKNETLAELPFEVRILYQGLWCLADRAGRMEDRPKRIKIEVFPYDRVDIEKGLEILAQSGFIFRYQVNDENYLEIPSFLKHNNPHVREQHSAIPVPAQCQHESSTSLARLNPSSLNPLSLNPLIPGKPDTTRLLPVRDWFESLWRRYPRRDGRKLAERSFYATVKTEQDWKDIQRALVQYISSQVVKKGYIKNGSTWFGNWRDWITGAEEPNASNGGTSIFEQAAKRNGKTETASNGKELTAGEVLASVRNLPPV